MGGTDETLKRLAAFAAAEGVPWVDTPENLATLQGDIRTLLAQSAALRDQLVDVRQRLAGAALCEGYANRRAVVAEDQAFATLTADLRLAQTERDQLRDQLARAEAVVEAARALALRLPPSGAALSFAAVRPWGEYRAALLLNLREALAARTPTPGAAGEVG